MSTHPSQSGECEHAGHAWADAGGGIQVCMVCETMRETPPCEHDWRLRGLDSWACSRPGCWATRTAIV
jgi:hypothetical protein